MAEGGVASTSKVSSTEKQIETDFLFFFSSSSSSSSSILPSCTRSRFEALARSIINRRAREDTRVRTSFVGYLLCHRGG